MFRSFLDYHQGAMFFLLMLYCNIHKLIRFCKHDVQAVRRIPSQLHSQQHISTQHDMPPQHPVYKNELNCECYNITLARKNIAP